MFLFNNREKQIAIKLKYLLLLYYAKEDEAEEFIAEYFQKVKDKEGIDYSLLKELLTAWGVSESDADDFIQMYKKTSYFNSLIKSKQAEKELPKQYRQDLEKLISEEAFSEIEHFIRHLRYKSYENISLGLEKTVFAPMDFMQAVRQGNGKYRVEIGGILSEERFLYKKSDIKKKEVVQLFRDVCVFGKPLDYSSWEDITKSMLFPDKVDDDDLFLMTKSTEFYSILKDELHKVNTQYDEVDKFLERLLNYLKGYKKNTFIAIETLLGEYLSKEQLEDFMGKLHIRIFLHLQCITEWENLLLQRDVEYIQWTKNRVDYPKYCELCKEYISKLPDSKKVLKAFSTSQKHNELLYRFYLLGWSVNMAVYFQGQMKTKFYF